MQLRKPDAPLDPSNRRISLIVHYLDVGNAAGGQDSQDANAASLPADFAAAAAAKQ
jgi:hypothetical protein